MHDSIPNPKKLTVRLLTVLVLAIVAILAVILVPATEHYQETMRSAFFAQTEAFAWRLLPVLRDEMNKPLQNRERLTRLSRVQGSLTAVYDHEGRLLAGNLPRSVDQPLRGWIAQNTVDPTEGRGIWKGELDTHCYALFPLVSRDGKRLGTFAVAKPGDAIHQATVKYVTAFLAGVLLICLVASLVVFAFFHRSVLRPINRIIKANLATADPLSAEQLIPAESIPNDELGQIMLTRNQMLLKLREAREELERWSKTLEVRVEDRTQELEAAQRQVFQAEKLATIGKLATSVAHEINNPLGIIHASLEDLQRGLDPSATVNGEAGRCFEIMHAQVQRCKRIVNSLLRYSRLAPGVTGEVLLAELFEETLELVRRRADEEQKRLVLELQDSQLSVACKRLPLQQTLVNLLENALDATRSGGTIRLRAHAVDQQQVEVSVEDDGEGVDEEHQANLFEPFFTTKPAGEGTGMGLAIASNFIRGEGGTIECLPSAEGGARFRILLGRPEAETVK